MKMKTTQKIYEYLLTQKKPVNYANVAEATGLGDRSTRGALRNLVDNSKLKIEVVKYPGKCGSKKLNTFLLLTRKPSCEVFKAPNHSIILQILQKCTKPISYKKCTELSRGKLTLDQVRMAVGEFITMSDHKLMKTKDGHTVLIQLATQEELRKHKASILPRANAFDLLIQGRAAEAVLKHNSIGGL